MKFGSLFAGIGGFDLGLERAGMECKWQVEIDDFCNRVLEKHWPHVKRYRDVREVGAHNLEPVDLICGGFPCQDISIAGVNWGRQGISGSRSGLWSEMCRIVRELRPRRLLVENVPAILSGGNGEWLGRVLGDLAEIGYDSEWHCIPASRVGAPHQRDRFWLLAYPNKQGVEGSWAARCPSIVGPWGWGGKRDFQALCDTPFQHRDNRWPKPILRRMDDGLLGRVDRLKSIGNAVVPQIVEIIGRAIMEAESHNE